MITETYFRVKPIEIDSLGIVHHSHYPIWFEAGRNNFFKTAEIPHYKMNLQGYFLPLMEMRCRYWGPARYGDELMLKTSLVYLSCVKVKFEYKLINKKNGNILVTGKTVHAWTNKKLQPINIEKDAPDIFFMLKELIEASGTV